MQSILHHQGSFYTDEERQTAVVAYLKLGNIRRVAVATGIPSRTLYDWQKTEWWDELSAQLRAERDAQLDFAFTKVIEKALCGLMDRLESGEVVIKKDGTITRKPIKARDIAYILSIVSSMREKLRNAMQTKQVIPLYELAGMLEMLGKAKSRTD